jgi:iron-sulfur cluster assembly protein
MITSPTQTEIITLTPTAAQAFHDLLRDRNLPDYALRVFVSSGGCSGIQTGLALEGNILEQDLTCEFYGVKVVVDEVSAEYLKGSTIDFVDGEKGTGFTITNPNPIASCCCGNAPSEDSSEGSGTYGGCTGCG